MKYKVISISEENKKRFIKIIGHLRMIRGERVSENEAFGELLDGWEQKEAEVKP